jgi:hypothetical protein
MERQRRVVLDRTHGRASTPAERVEIFIEHLEDRMMPPKRAVHPGPSVVCDLIRAAAESMVSTVNDAT